MSDWTRIADHPLLSEQGLMLDCEDGLILAYDTPPFWSANAAAVLAWTMITPPSTDWS